MKAALLNGIIGITLTFLVNIKMLHIPFFQLLLCIFAANCAGLFSLLLTLQVEKYAEKTKKRWLRGNIKTWSFLTFSFILALLCIAPATRDFHSFIVLFIPLLLSSGFSTLLFGPIQDRLVWREQKLQRKQHKV